jgi:hypothetical protein
VSISPSSALTTVGDRNDLRCFGLIVVGSNAVTLKLQWAQNTATASNTTLKAGTCLKIIKQTT